MERFREQLAQHAVIGLDTSIFIYHLEAYPRYLPLTRELLNGIKAGRQRAVTSTVTVRVDRSSVADGATGHSPGV